MLICGTPSSKNSDQNQVPMSRTEKVLMQDTKLQVIQWHTGGGWLPSLLFVKIIALLCGLPQCLIFNKIMSVISLKRFLKS